MLTPAIRAMRLPLTLLVTRVLADHEDRAVAADDLALLAHGLDRRSDLHAPRSTFETWKRTAQRPRRRLARSYNGERLAACVRLASWRKRNAQAALSTSRRPSSSCQ